jgi:hypothetical protein
LKVHQIMYNDSLEVKADYEVEILFGKGSLHKFFINQLWQEDESKRTKIKGYGL